MRCEIVGTGTETPMLDAVRSLLSSADDALLCTAFVRRAGVHLVERELDGLGDRARLVATTTFGGDSSTSALNTALGLSTRVRVRNPSRGTFHPKLYVSRAGDRATALVGSANLTGGLVTNVEVGTLLVGQSEEPTLRQAWEVAESYWAAADAAWQPLAAEVGDETFSPELLRLVRDAVAADPVFRTIAAGKPNRVVDANSGGLRIETEASRAKGSPAQEVPAWMLELAWEYLQTHGELTNQYLLADDGLNVKRSSAVCAILARLPGVVVASTSPIVLRWSGPSAPRPFTIVE